jgi:hypothetical protein
MSNIVIRETVTVWGQQYEVTVHQKSKAVWIARGDYMGEQIETQGQTQGAAVIRWREAAQYRGNI